MAENRSTRVRYIGPIDAVSTMVGDGYVEVVRHGEVELADHLNQQDAYRRAKELVETDEWTYVHRATSKDSGDASEGSDA
jgi:hypothetical protein